MNEFLRFQILLQPKACASSRANCVYISHALRWHGLSASLGKRSDDEFENMYYDWKDEFAVAVNVPVSEDEQESRPFHTNWRCKFPRADWRTNMERAQSNDAPVWIQCAADGALASLRDAYELNESSACSCTFAGFQSLFGGKKLTEDDCFGDALVVFNWEVGARKHVYSSKVLYAELARVADEYCGPSVPCNCKAGALVEIPTEMAQYLLRKDVHRRSMISAAKNSEAFAATVFSSGPPKTLQYMAVVPLQLLKFTSVRDGYAETQLPARQVLKCVYLGQPKDDGSFAHASLDWSSPEKGIIRTKVVLNGA